jgi:hypothetical protein
MKKIKNFHLCCMALLLGVILSSFTATSKFRQQSNFDFYLFIGNPATSELYDPNYYVPDLDPGCYLSGPGCGVWAEVGYIDPYYGPRPDLSSSTHQFVNRQY